MTSIPKRQLVSEPFVHQLDIIDKAIIEAQNQPSSPYINNSKPKRRVNSLVNQQQVQYQQYYKMKNDSMYSNQYYQYQQSSSPQVSHSRPKSQVPSQYSSPLVSSYVDVRPQQQQQPQIQIQIQPPQAPTNDFGRRVSAVSSSSSSTTPSSSTHSLLAQTSTTTSTTSSAKWSSNLFDPFKPVEFNTTPSTTTTTSTNLASGAGSTTTVGGNTNIWGTGPSDSRLFNNTVWA
ncbi:hypothetical protein DFJ63DRAFT_50506 [Scheffersomyces coipomensis]|uniref:uncharacterized protein n=1 Tax=Scheffersomyces coipomensis TaxID=1788519 RepID=UPI00315CC935